MRKLASVQIVRSLESIARADNIESALVLGWNVVVKKGEFRPDDLCVYFEVDSLLPEAPWSSFMQQHGYRLKTVRLRGSLSQGLALPMSILPSGEYRVGDDVTDRLGVRLWERPIIEGSDICGPFPPYVPQTDELRIQSAPELLDRLRGRPWYATVKVDGTSGTFAKIDGVLYVCCRSGQVRENDGWYWRAARRYRLPECLPDGFVVQGEVCGPGIQKNRLGLTGIELRVFNVLDAHHGMQLLSLDDMLDFCEASGLRTVDTDVRGARFNCSLEQLLLAAQGNYEGTENRREGIVVRPSVPAAGERLSFKVLNNDFLLHDED
jgi:RNA ligase (TIGR02306 family)